MCLERNVGIWAEKQEGTRKTKVPPPFFVGRTIRFRPLSWKKTFVVSFDSWHLPMHPRRNFKKKLVKAGYTYYSANVKRHLWKNSPRKVSPKKCCRCCRRLFSRYHPTAKVSAPSPPHWSSGLRVIPPIDHAEVRSHRIKPYEEHGRYGIELGKLRHLRWESTGCHFPQKK